MPIRLDPDPQTVVRKKLFAVAGDTHKVTLKTCTRLLSGINKLRQITGTSLSNVGADTGYIVSKVPLCSLSLLNIVCGVRPLAKISSVPSVFSLQ